MIEIRPRLGLPRDLPGSESALEAKFYPDPGEREPSAPGLGTDVELVVPQDGMKCAASVWEWRIALTCRPR